MKRVAVLLAFTMIFASGALASEITKFHPGTGRHNVLPGERDVCWSEPPDLEGLIGSSEQILMYGLETEIANDFYAGYDTDISVARFWGGYIGNSYPCESGMEYRGNNLRFYEDAGCIPARLPNQPPQYAEYLCLPCDEVVIICQGGYYPECEYHASVSVPVYAGYRYWFGAQMYDHPFPPQWGRLASAGVVDCDSVFWAPYFGYAEWTPCIDVFGLAFDASQEFECGTTATTTTSWGAVKRLYR